MNMLTKNLIFILLLTNLSSVLYAQQDAESAKPEADSTAVLPIPTSDIIIESASLQIQLEEEFEQLINQEQISQLKSQVDTLTEEIQLELTDIDSLSNLAAPSLRALRTEEKSLASLNDQASELQQTLLEEVQSLEKSLSTTTAQQNLWQLTYENAQAQSATPLILSRIAVSLGKLDSLREQLLNREDSLILTLDQITGQQLQVGRAIDAIDTNLSGGGGGNLYARQYPSLLQLSRIIAFSPTFTEAWQDFISFNQDFLVEYVNQQSYRFLFHLLIIFAVYAFLAFLRKHHSSDSSLTPKHYYYQQVTEVLLNNIGLTTWLFGLYIVPLLYADAPPVFSYTLLISIIIPFLLLTLKILPSSFKLSIYGLGVAFFLDHIYIIFPAESLLGRAIVLLNGIIISLVCLSSLSVITSHNLIHRKAIRNLIIAILVVYIFANLAVILANVSGYIFFAELVVLASRRSLIAGILTLMVTCLAIGSIEILLREVLAKQIHSVRRNMTGMRRLLFPLISLFFLYQWVNYTLGQFELQTSFNNWIASIWDYAIVIGEVEISVGAIFLFFFTLWVSSVVAQIIRSFLEDDVLPQFSLGKGLPYTISLLARYVIITIGFFIAIAIAGIQLTSLTVILGAFSVGIGFGLQNIFNNLVSGLILIFERPLQIGDTIEVGPLLGKVNSIGVRSSNIRSFDGAEVIVPNGNLISNEVINWTLSDNRRRIDLIIGVSYDSDPNTVQKLLLDIVTEREDILQDPAPLVFFHNLGDSSLDFRMLFWTDKFGDWVRIKSDVIFQVFYGLQKAGIEIPYPQRDIHLKPGDLSAVGDNGNNRIEEKQSSVK